jgi:hypothetical protein
MGVEAYSGYELTQWLASIAAVILTCTAIVVASSLAVLAVVLHRRRGLQHIDAPQWVAERCGAPRIPSQRAMPVGIVIVYAALAVSRWIEHCTGWSIRKFVKTARRYRTIQIQAGPHTFTAADPLPGDLLDALAHIHGPMSVH